MQEPVATSDVVGGAAAEGPSSGLVAAFLLATLFALLPIWTVRYPPGVDLPQHAAQVYVWQHFDDPDQPFRELYRIRLLSPYFLGYAITRLVAAVTDVNVALRAVLSLAVVGLPASLLLLARRFGADPWIALLGFPLAYGFAFYWGFFNYLIAVPVGVLYVALGATYARSPTVPLGTGLALGALVLYFGHALVFALCLPVVGLLILSRAPGLRAGLARALPLVPPAMVIASWMRWVRQDDASTTGRGLWADPFWERLVEMPSVLLGGGREQAVWAAGGVVLLLLPLVACRPALRPRWRVLPLLFAVAAFLFGPDRFLGTWFVAPRLTIFAALFYLVVFEPAVSLRRRQWGRASLLLFVLLWSTFLTVRLRPYDHEARRFDALLAEMEPGRRTLGLMFEPGFDQVNGLPVFGHFALWYQATKGGVAEYSFAMAFPSLVQYREATGTYAHPDLHIRPQLFDWRRDGRFDYFVVRSRRDRGRELFEGADFPVRLELRSGDWWLYRRLRTPWRRPAAAH